MTNFEKVGLFMKTFNQEVKTSSGLSSEKINTLRINLISEELEELKKAISDNTKQWSSIESNKKYIESHTHNNGTSNGCAFFDIPCKLKQIQNQMVMYAIIGAGAYVGIKYGLPVVKKMVLKR